MTLCGAVLVALVVFIAMLLIFGAVVAYGSDTDGPAGF